MIANMVYSDVALLFHILHKCNDLKKLADYVFLYSKVIIMTLRTIFDIKKITQALRWGRFMTIFTLLHKKNTQKNSKFGVIFSIFNIFSILIIANLMLFLYLCFTLARK
jgi:hypothetical protein